MSLVWRLSGPHSVLDALAEVRFLATLEIEARPFKIWPDLGVWTAWPDSPYSVWQYLSNRLIEKQVWLHSVLKQRLKIVNIQQFINYKHPNVNHVL